MQKIIFPILHGFYWQFLESLSNMSDISIYELDSAGHLEGNHPKEWENTGEYRLYLIEFDGGLVKLGISKDIVQRVNSFKTVLNIKRFCVSDYAISYKDAYDTEQQLHEMFSFGRYNNECFLLDYEEMKHHITHFLGMSFSNDYFTNEEYLEKQEGAN